MATIDDGVLPIHIWECTYLNRHTGDSPYFRTEPCTYRDACIMALAREDVGVYSDSALLRIDRIQ